MNISGITSNTTFDITDLTKTSKSTTIDTDGDNDTRPEPPSVDKIVSQLTSKLGLNDNQAIELKKVIQSNMKSMEANRSEQGGKPAAGVAPPAGGMRGPSKDMQDKMKSQISEMDTQVKKLLNPDQLKTFNAMIAERDSKTSSME